MLDFCVSDLAISKVFSEDGGVLGFVKLCLQQSKVFKSETVKSFDLFVKIIELYPTKIPKYATNVVIVRNIPQNRLISTLKNSSIQSFNLGFRFVFNIYVQCIR